MSEQYEPTTTTSPPSSSLLPFLQSKEVSQHVLTAIQQVPLTTLTDLTEQVLALYPTPIATVLPLPVSFSPNLSTPRVSSYPNEAASKVSSSSSGPSPPSPASSFSFTSHPLIFKNSSCTMTDHKVHQILSMDPDTDPAYFQKIMRALNQVSSNTLLKDVSSTVSTSSTKLKTTTTKLQTKNLNVIQPQNAGSFSPSTNETSKASFNSKLAPSTSEDRACALSSFSLPNSIFNLVYPTHASEHSFSPPKSILESYPETISALQTLLENVSISSMPKTRRKAAAPPYHAQVSVTQMSSPRSSGKLVPEVIVPCPTSPSAHATKAPRAPTTPTKDSFSNAAPCSPETSPPNDTVRWDGQENTPLDVKRLVPKKLFAANAAVQPRSNRVATHSASNQRETAKHKAIEDTSKPSKRRKRTNRTKDATPATVAEKPCPLQSPTSSTIPDPCALHSAVVVTPAFSLDATIERNPFNTFVPNKEKLGYSENNASYLVSNVKEHTSSSKTSENKRTSVQKLKKAKLDALLDQLQRCTNGPSSNSAGSSSSVMSSLFHALENHSAQLEEENASTILNLTLKSIEKTKPVDLFDQPEEHCLTTLQHFIDTLEAIQLGLKLLQLHASLTKENMLCLFITTINDQVTKCVLPMLEYLDRNLTVETRLRSGIPTPNTVSKRATERKSHGSREGRLQSQDRSLLNKDAEDNEEDGDILLKEPATKLFKGLFYLICNVIQQLHHFFMQYPLYLTDPMAVSTCYGLLYPLFTDLPVEDLLILRAMELVRLVFHLKPNLRVGILDEILCQLIHSVPSLATNTSADKISSSSSSSMKSATNSRRFKLINGQSIHLFSALLLNLVQSTITPDAQSLDPCPALCFHIFQHFVSRATKTGKKSEVTNESDHLLLLRLFTDDVFSVLSTPEFPCSELFCRSLLQLLFTWIQDEKSSDLLMKSFAMDVFSYALSKIHSFTSPRLSIASEEYKKAQAIVSSYFYHVSELDPALHHAFHYYQVEWKLNEKNVNSDVSDATSKEEVENQHYHEGFKNEVNGERGTHSTTSNGHRTLASSSHAKSIDDVAPSRDACLHQLSLLFPNRFLYQQADPMLLRILDWFESKDIHIRSRAIRVLSHTIEVNPGLMHRPDVERAIHSRLLDSSASVRDSVLEALGKWLSQPSQSVSDANTKKPSGLSVFYFNMLLGRILDKATSVRKRALKTLSRLQSQLTLDQQIQVAVKMVGRFQDEEESIVKLVQKLLCPLLIPALSSLSSSASASFTLSSVSTQDQSLLTYHGQVFCGLVKQSPLFDSLLAFLSEQATTSPNATGLLGLSLSLFQKLNYEAKPSLDLYRAFHLLMQARPMWMTLDMFYYFKTQLIHCPDTPEAWQIQSMQLSLLHLFLQCKQAPKRELDALEVLVCKIIVSGTMLANVHAAVKVLCEVVCYTLHADRFQKLKQHALSVLHTAAPSELRRILVLLGSIYAYPALSTSAEISAFVQHTISLFAQPQAEPLYTTAFTCLGWVFMASPALAIQPATLQLIQRFLRPKSPARPSWPMVEVIVDFIHKFMLNEDKVLLNRFKKENRSFDRKVFLGTSDEFAHSGISESLAQTFVTDLVTCALTATDPSQKRIVEILQDLLGYISVNRLAHPKFVMPAVVALSISPVPYIAAVAQMQHHKLHSQHRSILYDHLKESIRSAYQYRVAFGHTQGMVVVDEKPTALFHAWFQLLQAHPRDRHQFLHHMLMFFDTTQEKGGKAKRRDSLAEDLRFCTWLAEQLFWLDYKYEDDLVFIVRFIDARVVEQGESVQQELQDACSPSTIKLAACLLLLLQLRRFLLQVFPLKRSLGATIASLKPSRTKQVHRSTWDPAPFAFHLATELTSSAKAAASAAHEQLKSELDQAIIQVDSESDKYGTSESGVHTETVTTEAES